jgi:hypothetical protein
LVKEAKDAVIKLKTETNSDGSEDYTSEHPEAVKLMIDFMYLDDYEIAETSTNSVNDI